jgi:hypothetical protein
MDFLYDREDHLMSRSFLVKRWGEVLDTLKGSGRRKRRRSQSLAFASLEHLEGRALLATINPGAVISSTPVGADFNYTITLTNASSSGSGIGTFWYSWVPGEDFLASRPISVKPPAGWTDVITNEGGSDGFAIQFVASSPANDVRTGSSLSFSFTSADPPTSVNGNSVFFPGTPVGTSFVYPGAPFSDAGHEFQVTSASTSPPPPPPPPPSSPLVTVIGVAEVKNKKHLVSGLVVGFSGSVNAAQADRVATYRMAMANAKGSFAAKNSPTLKLSSAVFNSTSNTLTLTIKKPFAATKAAELTINGVLPSGLQDSSGRLIDGDHNGTAGGNAVALIRRTGVVLK